MSEDHPIPSVKASLLPAPRPRSVDGLLLQAAHEGIVVIDAQHRIVAFNRAAERIFACPAAQALGQPIERFFRLDGPDCQAWLDEQSGDAAQELDTRPSRRLLALRANGAELPVELSFSPVHLAVDGRPQRMLAALVCSQAGEQALRDEVEHLQLRLGVILELAPIAIWVADGDRIVFANRAAATLLGVGTADALVGRTVYDLVQPPAGAALREQVSLALAGHTGLPPLAARLATPSTDPAHQRELEIAVAVLPDHGKTTVQMVVAEVTQRRREAAELKRSRRLLRAFSASVVDAREQERRRIARELHDELGQRLSALKLELVSCAGDIGLSLSDARLNDMLAMLDDTMASVRQIAADLRPLMLDDLGLAAAVEWLASEATLRLGIRVTVDVSELAPEPDEPVAIAVYRMVQEALTNAARHARAKQVQVVLGCREGELALTVQDDGVGFTLPAAGRPGSYGLLGMQERARLLGGRVQIDNVPEGGGRLRVCLPLYGGRATDTVPGSFA